MSNSCFYFRFQQDVSALEGGFLVLAQRLRSRRQHISGKNCQIVYWPSWIPHEVMRQGAVTTEAPFLLSIHIGLVPILHLWSDEAVVYGETPPFIKKYF